MGNCFTTKKFTWNDVNQLRENGNFILIAYGCVYDVSEYVHQGCHPGGLTCFVNYNQHMNTDFDLHTKKGKKEWKKYKIGKLNQY